MADAALAGDTLAVRAALEGAARDRETRAISALTGRRSQVSGGQEAPAVPGRSRADLTRAANEFEGTFIRMLLSEMLPEEGSLFGSGPSGGIVRGMFVDSVGSSLAGRRALGIADMVERCMSEGDSPAGPREVPAGTAAAGRGDATGILGYLYA